MCVCVCVFSVFHCVLSDVHLVAAISPLIAPMSYILIHNWYSSPSVFAAATVDQCNADGVASADQRPPQQCIVQSPSTSVNMCRPSYPHVTTRPLNSLSIRLSYRRSRGMHTDFYWDSFVRMKQEPIRAWRHVPLAVRPPTTAPS